MSRSIRSHFGEISLQTARTEQKVIFGACFPLTIARALGKSTRMSWHIPDKKIKCNPLLPIYKIKNKATQRQKRATFTSLIFGERINYRLILSLFCSNLLYSIYPSPKRTGQNTGVEGDMIDCALKEQMSNWVVTSRVPCDVLCFFYFRTLRCLSCLDSDTVRYDEALARFSPIPLCRFFSCKAIQLLAVYWRCQPNAVQFFNEVLKWNFSFVKTLPRTSHAGPQCGDILRVRYPVPSPECTHEEILRWKVQMWLHYPGVSLQSIPLPRTGGQCSRNYEWSEVRKTWWWIWAEFSTLPENTSQRCSRRSHLHVRKGNV